VAGYAQDRREDRDIFRIRLRRRPVFHQDESESNGGESFDYVDNKDWITPSLSEGAKNIRGADVAASD